MSKTDKDRPWLIRAADRLDAGSAAYFRHSDYAHARGECDADVDPIERYKAGNNFSNYSSCGWTLPYSYFVSPPKDFIDEVWNGPERRRERDGLRNMAREYNTYGDLENDDFGNYQHRHNAEWLWW